MPDPDQPGTPAVTVRYWAAAREAAGVDHEVVPLPAGGSAAAVSAVLAVVLQRHPTLQPVLAVSSVLLDGRVVTASDTVESGVVLEVLPPFAGG